MRRAILVKYPVEGDPVLEFYKNALIAKEEFKELVKADGKDLAMAEVWTSSSGCTARKRFRDSAGTTSTILGEAQQIADKRNAKLDAEREAKEAKAEAAAKQAEEEKKAKEKSAAAKLEKLKPASPKEPEKKSPKSKK